MKLIAAKNRYRNVWFVATITLPLIIWAYFRNLRSNGNMKRKMFGENAYNWDATLVLGKRFLE